MKSIIFKLSFILISLSWAPTLHAALIITEVMANPDSLSDDDGEYFEVFNTGSIAIDISTLTISDEGSDSVDLSGLSGTIGAGDFAVFGRTGLSYVDFVYGSGFRLANGADEIIITNTADSMEISRLNYTDGDPFGVGVSIVLNDLANAVGGETVESDYIAEIAANSTLPSSDIGSPGSFGLTVPEPSSALLLMLGCMGGLARRRRD